MFNLRLVLVQRVRVGSVPFAHLSSGVELSLSSSELFHEAVWVIQPVNSSNRWPLFYYEKDFHSSAGLYFPALSPWGWPIRERSCVRPTSASMFVSLSCCRAHLSVSDPYHRAVSPASVVVLLRQMKRQIGCLSCHRSSGSTRLAGRSSVQPYEHRKGHVSVWAASFVVRLIVNGDATRGCRVTSISNSSQDDNMISELSQAWL